MKTYNPQSSSVSSSIGAWVNYSGASATELQRTRQQVFADFPDSVIIDGSDDWNDPIYRRPQAFLEKLGIKPLAFYHSGISGITRSGAVVSKDDFIVLEQKYSESFKSQILVNNCKLYYPGENQ